MAVPWGAIIGAVASMYASRQASRNNGSLTTRTDPWEAIVPNLLEARDTASNIFQEGPKDPFGSLLAPQDQLELDAQDQLQFQLDSPQLQQLISGFTNTAGPALNTTAPGQQVYGANQGSVNDVLQAAAGAAGVNPLSSNTPDPSSTISDFLNANADYGRVRELTEAATQPAIDIFNEQVLPGLRSDAISSGTFGGERAQALERASARDLHRNILQTSSQIAGQERNRADALRTTGANLASGTRLQERGLSEQERFNRIGQGLDASAQIINSGNIGLDQALQQFNSAASGGRSMVDLATLIPQLRGRLGEAKTERAQAELLDEAQRHEANQNAEADSLSQYINFLNSIGGGGGSVTQPNPYLMSPFQAGVGGAFVGNSLYNSFANPNQQQPQQPQQQQQPAPVGRLV